MQRQLKADGPPSPYVDEELAILESAVVSQDEGSECCSLFIGERAAIGAFEAVGMGIRK
ncbi:MAG: hypothetical protein QM589_11570 [Thermomicrobiales bacterium]